MVKQQRDCDHHPGFVIACKSKEEAIAIRNLHQEVELRTLRIEQEFSNWLNDNREELMALEGKDSLEMTPEESRASGRMNRWIDSPRRATVRAKLKELSTKYDGHPTEWCNRFTNNGSDPYVSYLSIPSTIYSRWFVERLEVQAASTKEADK